jgi:ProP effector
MSHDQNVMATLALLAERWPRCFVIFEQRRRPLKIGIHTDILAALDGAVTPAKLGHALRAYVHNSVYRSRLIAGATRVDLDGEPAGVVTKKEATSASVTRDSSPSKASPPAVKPTTTIAAVRRLSLADLKEAAQRRKAAVTP